MSESDEIRLWCWVLGDEYDRVFSVFIKRNALIDDLKTAIKGRKQSLKDVYPDSIVLYKVKFELRLEDFKEEEAQRINLEDGQKLESFEDVSSYWAKEPEKVLSVILPRPADTTITPSSSENSDLSANSPPTWLVEIHSQLWGQRDFLGEIFRTATVDKDDFTELQDLLDALNPERNSDKYVSKDVLDTKSKFLRGKSIGQDQYLLDGLVPRPDLGPCQPPSSDVVNEDGVVDDNDVVMDNGDVVMDDNAAMVIDNTHLPNEATAIFPYTIQYMDLTVLRSTKKLRVPRLMLFRNEWGTMIDIFNKRGKGIDGSALFSGQPGIGKTCMLYSILILCIILARPIVFQDVRGKVFVISNTVRPLGTPGVSVDADDVLTLVDADNTVCQPNEQLFDHDKYRILVTSSPKKREDRKWLKQFVGLHAMFMVELWSREELVVASLFLQSNDVTLKQLQEASRICGNIPRVCFEAAISPTALRDAQDDIRGAIAKTEGLSDAVNDMRMGGETVIHRVFQIRPSYKERLWNSCIVEPVSDWAFSQMMELLDERRAGAPYEFYCGIKGLSDGNVLAGRYFEHCLHKFLKRSSQAFTIRSLDDRSTLGIRFTSDTECFEDKECFSGYLALSVESERPCYLQPLSPVFPSFGSFLYQPGMSESGFSPLIALQATIAAEHDIKLKGLEDLRTSLKYNVSALKDLGPTLEKKMIILFVVPDTLQATFVKQTIVGTKQKPSWDRRTAQYLLALSENEVFKAM